MVDANNGKNTPSGTDDPISISNEYRGYQDTLALYKRKAKDCPKGVRLKLQKQKFLMLQFTEPVTGKITVKSSGEQFTDEGIINAVNKCWLISEALGKFESNGEFWSWYDEQILGKSTMVDNLKTYREIFTELENAYFSGKHKNTKRKRSRESVNDIRSYKRFYQDCFNRFPDWDTYPSIQDFKAVINGLIIGTKNAKNNACVLRKIAELSHDAKRIVEYLGSINFSQNIYAEKQSIDYSTFLQWFKSVKAKALNNPNKTQSDKTLAWLWVCAMGVIYGLRPTEIVAAKNISESYGVDGVTFKAITDPKNREKLLYLGDFTYTNVSIKTGARVARPMASVHVMNELEIEQFPGLPLVESLKASAISGNYRGFLIRNDCPVTQAYAFRHLANQLGELNGIPQEIRARSLGHSVAVNESVYKKRSNLKTTVDLLTQHAKQSLPMNLALEQLQTLGVDITDKNVLLILNVIYQIQKE